MDLLCTMLVAMGGILFTPHGHGVETLSNTELESLSAPSDRYPTVGRPAALERPTTFVTLSELELQGAEVQRLLREISPNGSLSEQWVITIPQGVTIGHGAIVTSDGKVFADTETFRSDQHRLVSGNFDWEKQPIYYCKGRLAVIASPGEENWYHWLLQILPRLSILAASGLTFDAIYLCTATGQLTSWQRKSLEIVARKLQLPHSIFIIGDEQSVIQATELVVPSVPHVPAKPDRRVFPKWEHDFLHRCFLDLDDDTTHQFKKRLYISRAKASLRRIINEEEICTMLRSYDFDIVALEELSPAEQAARFHAADLIVGPHGSGFANLVFARPGTCIIEIDHSIEGLAQRSAFKGLAGMLQCNYRPYYVDLVAEENLEADLFVEINSFESIIQMLCENRHG